ncbi:hypothetical protein [Streptomyces pilosus]|uniref:Uncharacterized protein n=1 Tax=Streptomyces pilosus TaxID=28893 RepID=A0A918BXN2_9ACTN|nr:hypothetical protein [Streptomyces pilosus]GGQ96066.1 hypothetical protein GCM10010280_49510 [Streptomyces pilosus]GGV65543.1 hypothetical protein GCM10010261_56980 [Streptomyces pilosus]
MRSQDDSGQTGIGSPADPSLPVFVDSTGRRARVLRRAGYGVAGTAAAYLAVLGLSLLGATPFAPDALLPPLPGESTAPTAPERQGRDDGPRPPSGVLDPERGGVGDAGTAVGPGSLLVPLTAPGGPQLAPVTPPVPGDPVPAEPEPPADPQTPQEPDAPAPDEPSAPAPDDPSAPGTDPVPPPPDDPSAPEPPPGTPEPTPPAEPPQTPSGPPEAPGPPPATGGAPTGDTPAAGAS